VIDLLPEQKDVADMGGTMRLGASPTKVIEGTKAFTAMARRSSTSGTVIAMK